MIMKNIGMNATVLTRLTYVSRAKPDLSSDDLKAILKTAQMSNLNSGITGMLCFNKQFFLQTIEGSRPQISKLYNKLTADNRHYDLQIIEFVEIQARSWPQWSMDYATPTSQNRDIFLKHSSSENFNPYLISADAAQDLMNELTAKD